jgi:O-acetyl-ADP-ribose deacetylase (regulator of RNase III)/uncharacterized protein YwgA
MVKVLIGNLFDSDAQTLVNTVNCVGIMGKGIALEFKKRFPEMFQDYVARCERGEVRLGRPYLHRTLLPPWVLNFPTKDHWRSVAKLDDIVRGLEYLLTHYEEWGITSLAVPPLGCGEGQLEWRVVGPTLYRYLDRMEIPVDLYAPYGTAAEQLEPVFLGAALRPAEPVSQAERIPAAWVALVAILQRIEEQPYHWPVGRIIFQKIAYVSALEGLPTGLEHQRGSYGPFAPALKGWVTKLANNGLIREEQKGNAFTVKVGPTFADAQQAYAPELARWNDLIERVADLFIRLNTNQAEIVATVFYATEELRRQEPRPSEQDVLRNVMTWKQRRKPPLNEGEVAWTIRNLAALGWLPVQASEDLPLLREENALYG